MSQRVSQNQSPVVKSPKLKSAGMPVMSLCEWELVVAAYAYEIMHRPIMSDSTFDFLAREVLVPNIPDFSPDTGQWVYGLDLDVIALVYNECRAQWPQHDDIAGTTIAGALERYTIPYTCCTSPLGCWRDYSAFVVQ